jgi:hypothetical protein
MAATAWKKLGFSAMLANFYVSNTKFVKKHFDRCAGAQFRFNIQLPNAIAVQLVPVKSFRSRNVLELHHHKILQA